MKQQLIPTLSSKEFYTMSRIDDCPIHRHTNCEFLFIIDGNIINTVNDMSVIACAGSIYFINDRVTHALQRTGKHYEHRDVYISSATLQKICDEYFDNAFYQYLMSTNKIIQISITADLFNSFKERLQRNQTLYSLQPKNKVSIKKSNLNIIISLLGILYEQLPTYPTSKQDWLDAFLEKIQSPKIFTLPISKIIQLSNYSTSYFSHQFTKIFNMPFKTYVTKLKVDYAKILLTTPSFPLTEIAFICGFSSQSHFTQIFKSITGTTPYQYRKTHIIEG